MAFLQDLLVEVVPQTFSGPVLSSLIRGRGASGSSPFFSKAQAQLGRTDDELIQLKLFPPDRAQPVERSHSVFRQTGLRRPP